MDGRYLIYKGFGSEANTIFAGLAKKYNFYIKQNSDSGVYLENNELVIEISYETGLQIWIKNKKSNEYEMLFDIAKKKGIEKQLLNIIGKEFYKDREKSMLTLSAFLEDNFAKEFSGQKGEEGFDSD